MSINNTGLSYEIECDICGDETNRCFDSFYEAVEWKKDKLHGWISRKINGQWHDICPECSEEEGE